VLLDTCVGDSERIVDREITLFPSPEGGGQSQFERAYQSIRQKILSREIGLGAPLSRRKLADELGMSFGPVSEALVELERDGLVESLPRVGTRVCIPSREKIRDHYVIREALETQSARLFAQKASPEERHELEEAAIRLDKFNEDGSLVSSDLNVYLATQESHLKFHIRIAECSGSAGLRRLINQNQILLMTWLFRDKVVQNPPNWHRSLMHALAGYDPLVAQEAMRNHVRHGVEKLLEDLSDDVLRQFRRQEYAPRRR
jgi:DNA-binding GntR family transcriptional regulator